MTSSASPLRSPRLRRPSLCRAIARHIRAVGVAVGFGLLASVALAFNGHKVSAPPLSLEIEPIGTLTERGAPKTVTVTLANADSEALSVDLDWSGLVDGCSAIGETRRTVALPASGRTAVQFQFVAGPETYSAHYPLHVRARTHAAGKVVEAHAVDVFATEFKTPPASVAARKAASGSDLIELAPGGAVALATRATQRVSWSYFGKDTITHPAGWQGNDATSAASFQRGPIARGEERAALQMHPPYRGGTGVVSADYRLRLPDRKPLRLFFHNAIRDNGPREPASDGVTFLVWVDGEKRFERHTDAKMWLPGEVDLSAYAGREIALRLECHPGPRRNTTCDSAYWGDPVVVSGERPAPLAPEARAALLESARNAALASKSSPASTKPTPAPARTSATPVAGGHSTARAHPHEAPGLFLFELAGGARAALHLGPSGLADGALAFAQDGRSVVLDGFTLAVLDSRLGPAASELVTENVSASRTADGRVRVTHRVRCHADAFDLTAEIWADGPGLRVRIDCPQRLTDLAPGAADRLARRVYFGHGYCIEEPKAFRMAGGGHNLAASHVGCDFEGGLSLLTACDTPPDFFAVDPARRLYALHTKPASTFTFVPGTRGAFDCALAFRALSEKRPSAGVAAKAGRFVFDFWGRTYRDTAERLRRAVAYGLTDSLLVLHVWQRWGYDYRLPDIFPPDPKNGTLDDMQALSALCASHGIPFAPHDNYIDFYPDADGFSYDHITFDAEGRPRKAWINNSRDAQSYQFRPDHLRPFLERNLRLIVPAMRPTSYFVDVFASANAFDYHDRQGNFHSKIETQRLWGEAFAAIRDAMGGRAPTISEAGADFLIGWLDGADCQFLELSPKPRMFQLAVAAKSWTRVPWMDAVHHARFSLHGVGYSGRYQGGASRALRGIESDDYLSAELLTGHALMTDLQAGVRGDVRKYWLAQDFIRSIALDDIASVAFENDDPRRLTVTWRSGAVVRVNRGDDDWTVGGRVLPPCGYWAANGRIESAIERRAGAVVEWSRSGDERLYVNGRGPQPDAPLPIRPSAGELRHLGGRRFALPIHWDAAAPVPRDLHSFVHIYQPQKSRLKKTGWVAWSGKPEVPTSRWQGRVTTGAGLEFTMPDDCPPGEYEITVGLYDPRTRGAPRQRLVGEEDSERRILIGTLVVEGNKGAVAAMRLEPADALPAWQAERLAPNARPTDFGAIATDGACRIASVAGVVAADGKAAATATAPTSTASASSTTTTTTTLWSLTPLPDSPTCTYRFRPASLPGAAPGRTPASIAAIEALNEAGAVLRTVPHRIEGDAVAFEAEAGVFSYRIR